MSGETDWREAARSLMANARIGFLATQGEHGPESSMAPFAVHEGIILLHLSALARHTANLKRHAQAGFMVCTPETAMGSPLALPRLSLQGEARPLAANDLEAGRATYLLVIPEAEPLFRFGDFRLFGLQPERIQWVGGFGAAHRMSRQQWQGLCTA